MTNEPSESALKTRRRRQIGRLAKEILAKDKEVSEIEAEYNGLAARGLTGKHPRREVAAFRELLIKEQLELGIKLHEAIKLGVSIQALIDGAVYKEDKKYD